MTAARHRKNRPAKAAKPPAVTPDSAVVSSLEKPVKAASTQSRQPPRTNRLSWLGPAILGMLVYGLSWWQIEPSLQYHARAPVFLLEARFLKDFLAYPGGLADCLAAFLLQFYLHPWLGALISTLLMSLICVASEGILLRLNLPSRWQTPWLSVPLILLMQSHYEFPWMELLLGIAAVLGGVNAYLMWLSKPAGWRAIGFLLLAVPLYYFSGGVFLLYGLLCGLCEMLHHQTWLARLGMGVGCWTVSGLLPLLASRWIFVISTLDAYWRWRPTRYWPHHFGFAVALLLFFPLLLLGHAVIQGLSAAEASSVEKPRKSWRHRLSSAWAAGPARPLAASGPWLALILLLFLGLQDRQEKMRIEVDYYAQHQQWERVLRLGSQISNPDPAIIFDLNQALGHTGRLLKDMFSFPQRAGWDFWFYLHDTLDSFRTLKASDALFELGQINHAERMASEDIELNGDHPAVLQRLALINVLKGKPQAARLFLNLLAKTITHRAWAQQCLSQLEADPALSQDPELQRIRSFMLRKDYEGNYDTEALMYQLLLQNRKNRLAFDYLMAHYLLTRQVDKVAQHIVWLNEFDDHEIPRHCEEAILMHQVLNKNQPVNLYGRSIHPQTREDFNRFNQVIKIHGGDLPRALPELKRDFGNTFWFYRLYSCSASMVPYVKFQTHP